MQIVWLKRDLRLHDNEALYEAAKCGKLILLYIIEPELWKQPVMSKRHYDFLLECLGDLKEHLVIKVGEAVQVLDALHKDCKISNLWSHQETWTWWTYQRDIAVGKWAKKNNINWHEPTQNGVVRKLQDRDGWAYQWNIKMNKPILPVPEMDILKPDSDKIPTAKQLGLDDDDCTIRQTGGREEGLRLLNDFLYERGGGYTKEMSSPVTAFESCSRISPHLAFGCISIKEVYQAAKARRDELVPRKSGKWPSAMRSFMGRLRWHCHFIQKLEDEPEIEFENFHKAYDGMREDDWNEEYFQAWKTGNTGYPMVDACMRALISHSWINFRMRAMLVSFASYHLWLDWRKTSKHLARVFTDYEPGIHYSQMQMQSGTTGINAIRIYNPIKQGYDQDPEGEFIREWVPELSKIPISFIHEPWKNPSLMDSYPMPIVDEKRARREASAKIYAKRKEAGFRDEAKKIVGKHGSRKSYVKRGTNSQKKEKQGQLPL